MIQNDAQFLMEKRLHELDPELHSRFTSVVFAMQNALSRYRRLFPGYTDHSELHSLTVINFCNILIGDSQIDMLNADEIYVLLMGCYLHDVGMGISAADYETMKWELDWKSYFKNHPDAYESYFVRDYHHEFSALFIRKYAQMLEIPTPEHLFCIVQVARGHRCTDLFDEEEYPAAYLLPNGNTVCLPYLSALIRLADEIDVVADRNPKILYDIESIMDAHQIYYNRLNEAVPRMHVSGEGFLLDVETDDEILLAGIEEMVGKLQATLDMCRAVVRQRTPFRISQKYVDKRRI